MTQETYLGNAFSLQMLPYNTALVRIRRLSVEEAKKLLSGGFISTIGHEVTARVLERLLGLPVQMNRINIVLKPGSKLVVFQITAGRVSGELTEEQINQIIREGKYEFKLVEVENAQ